MIPHYFIRIPTFPYTPNGKMDKKSLVLHYQPNKKDFFQKTQEPLKNNPSTKIKTETSSIKENILSLWKDLTGESCVFEDSNFFEIGGDSLLAIKAIEKIKKEHHFDVSIRSMIEDTLAQIVEKMEGNIARPIQKKSSYSTLHAPLFFGSKKALFGFYYPCIDDFFKRKKKKALSKGAILLCPPLFMETSNIHLAYQQLGKNLSKSGYDVLRFDYFGTGNSLGTDAEIRLSLCLDNIIEAAHFLKKISYHSNISIIGFRYGANLALQANIPFLERLILWEPIVNPYQYINERYCQYRKMLNELNLIRQTPALQKAQEIFGFELNAHFKFSIENEESFTIQHLKKAKQLFIFRSNIKNSHDIFFKKIAKKRELLGKPTYSETLNEKINSIDEYNDLSVYLPYKLLQKMTLLFTEDSLSQKKIDETLPDKEKQKSELTFYQYKNKKRHFYNINLLKQNVHLNKASNQRHIHFQQEKKG
jgi:hypothetical protein